MLELNNQTFTVKTQLTLPWRPYTMSIAWMMLNFWPIYWKFARNPSIFGSKTNRNNFKLNDTHRKVRISTFEIVKKNTLINKFASFLSKFQFKLLQNHLNVQKLANSIAVTRFWLIISQAKWNPKMLNCLMIVNFRQNHYAERIGGLNAVCWLFA